MKLDSVKIENYKSISNLCIDFTQSDNIASLVGQNESGKSSILKALRDFYDKEFDEDSKPYGLGENLEQIVTCRFSFEKKEDKKEIFEKLETYINEELFNSEVRFKKGAINKISEIEVYFDGKNYWFPNYLDDVFINALEIVDTAKESNHDALTSKEKEDVLAVEVEEEIAVDTLFPELSEYFVYNIAPEFIFFEGGDCDILPGSISIDTLQDKSGEGWLAVEWLQECLQELSNNSDFSFEKLASTKSIDRHQQINQRSLEISADFKRDFSQRIHGIENDELGIVFSHDRRTRPDDEGIKDFIDFAVKTSEGNALPVRMRSEGMIWFLSFWLALKSLREKKSLILVDEPDRSLHINAQKDLLRVFEKIAKKFGHQIVYTTHAPSLIPLDTIYRVYLVFNDKEKGTFCENILKTQVGNSKNKQEAISVVNYAIGCSVPHENLIFKKNNVILEGVSDYMIFSAMSILLDEELDYVFVPGVGASGSKLNPLVGICIGYNLNWCVVIDGGDVGHKKYKDLLEGVFAGDKEKADEKIKLLSVSDIEDMFTVDDIKLIAELSGDFKLSKEPSPKDNVAFIGGKRKNIFAKLFLELVKSKKIKKDQLSNTAIKSFEEIFEFIPQSLKVDSGLL